MIRVLALVAGLMGAAAGSQFPEFSQQYVQRLGGTVDALEQVVADFDASAQAEGLSRADALAQMVGSDFVARRRADMERTIDRYDRLNRQLRDVQATGTFTRAYLATSADTQIAQATWANFQPAMPLTVAGAMFAGAGFLAGWAGLGATLGVLSGVLRPIRRKRVA